MYTVSAFDNQNRVRVGKEWTFATFEEANSQATKILASRTLDTKHLSAFIAPKV